MKKILTAVACVSFLAGCSDDGSSDNNDAETGYLTYNGVRGLTYQTASQSGVTGARGEFRYYPGETVTFSLDDMVLFADVPAKERLSPLDLIPSYAERLAQGTFKNGLTTHVDVEAQLINSSTRLTNVFGLLLALDEDSSSENGINISDDTLTRIEQFQLDGVINFDIPVSDFGDPNNKSAPENRFIWGICFRGQQILTCEDPLAGREIGTDDAVRIYFTRELNAFTSDIANSIYLTPYTLTLPAGDSAIQTVQIRRLNADLEIAETEIFTTTPSVLTIHSIDPSAGQFSFFASGEAGSKGEILVNIRLQNDYRWIPKNMGINIQ